MFENIANFFKKLIKSEKKEPGSKEVAKERLHLALIQDRANVSADFLELMKQEIIEVIKKYIEIDEKEMDVRLTNNENEDGTNGAPLLYANIPILNIKNEMKKKVMTENKDKAIINDEKKSEEESKNEVTSNSKQEELKEQKAEIVINNEQEVSEQSKNETSVNDGEMKVKPTIEETVESSNLEKTEEMETNKEESKGNDLNNKEAITNE